MSDGSIDLFWIFFLQCRESFHQEFLLFGINLLGHFPQHISSCVFLVLFVPKTVKEVIISRELQKHGLIISHQAPEVGIFSGLVQDFAHRLQRDVRPGKCRLFLQCSIGQK